MQNTNFDGIPGNLRQFPRVSGVKQKFDIKHPAILSFNYFLSFHYLCASWVA